MDALREVVEKLKEQELIEWSVSEWYNPTVIVKKANGGYCLCIDFRKLNEVAKKDAYPMRNMNDILDKLRSARYISKIYLSQAFHQIPLSEDSKQYFWTGW